MKKLIFLAITLILVLVGCSTPEKTEKIENKETKETKQAQNQELDREMIKQWQGETKEFLDKQPTIGDKNAPITMIEFADFKCPYCRQWEEEVYPWVKEEYIDKGTVKLVFLNFPFIGPDSNTAAIAGESIYKQNEDAFWEYYELMYDNQGNEQKQWANKEFILDLVKDIEGMDIKQLEKDIDKETYKQAVQDDRMFAMESQVTSTPTIIVNGYTISNSFDKATLQNFIKEYLND